MGRALFLSEGFHKRLHHGGENFQRDLAKYEEQAAVILGVSVDTAQSHKDFCTKEGLNFKLLADPDAKVSTDYGSVMDYKGSKMAARNTFIIDPKGEIAKVYTAREARRAQRASAQGSGRFKEKLIILPNRELTREPVRILPR